MKLCILVLAVITPVLSGSHKHHSKLHSLDDCSSKLENGDDKLNEDLLHRFKGLMFKCYLYVNEPTDRQHFHVIGPGELGGSSDVKNLIEEIQRGFEEHDLQNSNRRIQFACKSVTGSFYCVFKTGPRLAGIMPLSRLRRSLRSPRSRR